MDGIGVTGYGLRVTGYGLRVTGDNMTEWRLLPICGVYKSFYASNTGQILSMLKSSKKVHALRARKENYSPAAKQKSNYGQNYLRLSHRHYQLEGALVHRLVASVFCPCSSLFHTEVDHIDGNKYNNNAANLRWVTPKENIRARHALKRGEIKITNLQKSMFYVK